MSDALRIAAADGYALNGRVFSGSAGGPVVIINSAMGVPQRYYARFAEWLSRHDVTVLTWDYRGIGESRPRSLRGFEGTLSDWGRHDFEGVLRFAQREFAGRPLVAVGHSVGGQLLGQAPSNQLLSRVVTVASQVGAWNLWPQPMRWAMAGVWFALMPALTHSFGFLPGQFGIGEDLPKNVALEWAKWCRSRDYFFGHGTSREGYSRLTMPLLAYSFSDDRYAPKPTVDGLVAAYSGAQLDRRHLTPKDIGASSIKHFGFFRPQFESTLWTQVRDFVLDARPATSRPFTAAAVAAVPPAALGSPVAAGPAH